MERVQDFYIFTLPFFVMGNIWLRAPQKKYCQYIFIVLNMLLLLHALHQIRVVIGLAQVVRVVGGVETDQLKWSDYLDAHILRMIGYLLLPLLFMFKSLRANRWVTAVVYLLVLKQYTRMYMQPQEIFFVMANGVSLFAVVYALFWLLKLFPAPPKTN
jgi:hypothetical protein